MKSYLLGFLGFALTIILLSLVARHLYLRKENADTRKTIIISVIGLLIILIYFFIIKSLFGFQTDEKDSLLYTILFTLLITPLFEEIIYRRWVLQHYLNLTKEKIKLKHFTFGIWIALSFTLPTLIFFLFGWINSFSIKNYSIVFLFSLFPLVIMFFLQNNKSKLNNLLIIFVIIVSQSFLFTMGHGDYASKFHLATGLLYGILYLSSKSIIPSLAAHYIWNLLIFIYSL